MTLMKLRLGLPFTDLSQHFRMYLVVVALKYFNSWSWVRGDGKSFICVLELKSHTTITQITSHKFSTFREPQQKAFVTLIRFWLFKGLGAWMNLLKNENLRRESFFRNCWIRF